MRRLNYSDVPKSIDGMANSVDPDQFRSSPILLKEQSDLGLDCLLRPVCPKTKNHSGNCVLV